MGEGLADLDRVRTTGDLGETLRRLRRRQARRCGTPELSYRELAARTGWAHGAVGEYLSGRTLPPTDRFDVLVLLLGASPAERGALATARDRVAEARRAPTSTVPRELPPAVSAFAGREAEHAELDGLLTAATAPAVVAIVGTAGVGKTALAVSWAHRAGGRFPDGQLYLDLRGHHPQRPLQPEHALTALLHALGVSDGTGESDVDELARRFRSTLAGRRVLVVLDNAATPEQVRPLLPGTPGCVVLVTSRDDLAGLVARDGAHRLHVGPLPDTAAVGLLGTLVGARVAAEPVAAQALADRCARLPLALRIAAELAAARQDLPLADLVAELDARRLDTLDGDDAPAAIRSVFSWSLRRLPDEADRCFRLVGLVPGYDVDAAAVTALTGGDGRRLLDRLERAHLVERRAGGRHRMHDLLAAYAAELGAALPEAPAATTRLLDHYVDTTAAAMDVAFPLEADCRPLSATASFADADTALAWLDAERANLVAAAAHAARHGWPTHCADLGRALWRYLDSFGHYRDGLAMHTTALEAATTDTERAEALTNLGLIHWRLGRCELSAELLTRALELRRANGDRPGEARALAGLGVVLDQLSRFPESLAHHDAAMAAYTGLGDRRRLALVLGNLGALYWRLGRLAEAAECHERAAAAGRELGDERIEGYALANLGLVYQRLGRHSDAVRSHRHALAASRRHGDRRAEGETLGGLGFTYLLMGLLPEAVAHIEQALDIATELGNPCQRTEALNSLGSAFLAQRRFDDALARYDEAHTMAVEVSDRYEQARALDGAAAALDGAGRPADASTRRRQAAVINAELGLAGVAQLHG